MDSKRFGDKVRTQSLTNVVTVVRIIFLSCQILFFPRWDLNSHHWYTAVCSTNHLALSPAPYATLPYSLHGAMTTNNLNLYNIYL